MKKTLAIIISAAVFGMIGTSQATLIDFTEKSWYSADEMNNYSKTIDGIEVTLDAGKNKFLDWSKYDGTNPVPFGLAGAGDGIGIHKKGNDDEISKGEKLTISFSPKVIVNEIFVFDIFNNKKEKEYSKYKLQGGTWTKVFGLTGASSLSIFTGSTDAVKWIKFTSDHKMSDYAVAGLNVTNPVPEPTTMLLFGTGIAGLVASRRKRKK